MPLQSLKKLLRLVTRIPSTKMEQKRMTALVKRAKMMASEKFSSMRATREDALMSGEVRSRLALLTDSR